MFMWDEVRCVEGQAAFFVTQLCYTLDTIMVGKASIMLARRIEKRWFTYEIFIGCLRSAQL